MPRVGAAEEIQLLPEPQQSEEEKKLFTPIPGPIPGPATSLTVDPQALHQERTGKTNLWRWVPWDMRSVLPSQQEPKSKQVGPALQTSPVS